MHNDQQRTKLFDVSVDPGETVNLALEQPAIVKRLMDVFDAKITAPIGVVIDDRRGQKDPELEAALKELGYAGDE